jgi:prevent-host-death family protein
MRSIGVRELRQQASRYLREVEQGETIEVTDRGRPIARLVPLPRAGALEELETSGRLTRAAGDVLELGPPMAPAPAVVLPGEALSGLRADER